MTFHGSPPGALAFYRGLELDNSRTYWTKLTPVYEASVLAPMTALLDQRAPEFGEGKIFRPNRNIRCSADKSPNKTAIAPLVPTGTAGATSLGNVA